MLEGISSSMREAFSVCDQEMSPYAETAREFCDIDGGGTAGGGAGVGGGGASANESGVGTASGI